jgi:predicted dehydrogenase
VAPNIKLVTVADAFEDRAERSCKLLKERFGEQFAVPEDQVFVGLDAYQKALSCHVDVAILTAPPGFRPLHYRAAVEAGTHVFMEKPLCVDAGSFRKMMDINKLADEKSRKVGVGLFRRHNPTYQEQMRQVHEGKIGKIQFLRCYCNMASWGAFPKKPGETEMEYQVRNWRVFDWLGGGRLVEAHCHELDVMDWAMKDHPTECNGMGGRTPLSSEPRFGQDYDHHFHEYTYADGTKMYSQSRTLNGTWSPITEHIHGDKGVFDLNGKIMKINEFRNRERTNPYRKEWEDLINAIWNDRPYNEGWFGTTSSFSGVLGREASYCGQVVNWDELAAKGPDLFPKEEFTWESRPPVLPDEQGSYEHAVALPGIYRLY